jgi:hypothetical protein
VEGFIRTDTKLGMVVHVCNPSIQGAEVGGLRV